jgi:oxygen-independent coproporphyrinogen III oxidase
VQVDLSLIKKYDVSGPRYTSYPTALQFEESSDEQYRRVVGSLTRQDPLSLYLHIPFCNTLCYYCACNKIVTRDKSRAETYLSYLYREIEMVSELYGRRQVLQLHWGGGTPTFIDDDQILDLSRHLRQHFSFGSDQDGEFSIEIDPRTVDPGRIANLRNAGFNRLSMGIQDFDETVQKAVNRKQSFEATQEVIGAARHHGFESISVDLIYGLPFQTQATIDRTLSQVIALGPDRISLYNYAHLPNMFMPQKRINVVDLPLAEQKLQIFKLCMERLTAEGYSYIGMDHFAKPGDELAVAQRQGTLHRNFQGYSTFAGFDLVAMGITGITQLERTYFQNTKEMDEYESLIDVGRIPIKKVIHVDDDDIIRRTVIMALICQFRLEYAEIDKRFGISFQHEFAMQIQALESMQNDGLLTLTGKGIEVSEIGRLLIRNICMVFDRHLKPVEDRGFSKVL